MIQIGTFSYGLATIAFTALSVLLLLSWRGRLQGALLVVASAVTTLWALVITYQISIGRPYLALVDIMEVLRNVCWLAFLLAVLSTAGAAHKKLSKLLRAATIALVLIAITLIGLAVFETPNIFQSFLTPDYFTGIISRVVLSLAGVVIIHQLYINVPTEQRWGIKFICLGLGVLFVYDFYLYADAMLFKRLDATIWDARGIINSFTVPLIAISAARNADWSLEISVSRKIVFQSTTLIGAGVYLLGMAAAGYYIRYFGGQWGTIFQVTFLFGALILLLIVLFSGTARAWLKIYLSKHFFSYRYDYREEWLRFTRTLSEGEPGVQLRERSIKAIAELVESPGGALWLRRDTGNFEPAAHYNLPEATGTLEAESDFVKFLEQREWVINLDECYTHPERYDDLVLPNFFRSISRAWIMVPLILHERLMGFILLARSRAKVNMNWEISDLLKTAGRQAASYLAHLEGANALLIAKQFDSFNRMSAFIVHDLKNLVSQLSLLVSNAEKHKHNPEFQQDMLETVVNSVEKMKRLLTQLKTGNPIPDAPAKLELENIVKQAIDVQAGFSIIPTLANIEAAQVIASKDKLVRVIGHLIRNAIEASLPEGKVWVDIQSEKKFSVIKVSDNGRGMSETFIREKLFRPFESTKQNGMGIGTYECQQYIVELGGRIEVESTESEGTIFKVLLPKLDTQMDKQDAFKLEGAL